MPIVILNSMVLLNLNCFSGLFFLRKLLDQIIYVHPISRLVWKARGISKIRCYIFVRLWEIYFSRIRNIFVCSHLLISWKGVRYFSDKVLYICQIMRNIFLKDQIYICQNMRNIFLKDHIYICQIMKNIFLKNQIYICVLPISWLVG